VLDVPEQDLCLGSQARCTLVMPGTVELTCRALPLIGLCAHDLLHLSLAQRSPLDLGVTQSGN
jgi:hypothetical protein